MTQLQREMNASSLAQRNLTKRVGKQLPAMGNGRKRLNTERVEELRVSSEIAQEANLGKTDFIKTLSHELPMPIHVILGCGELLLDGAWGMLQESQKTIVVKMTQNACYLFDLVTDLIELNRLDGGRDAARFDKFDVRRFLKEVEAMTRFMPKVEGVVLESKIPPGLPALFSDWDRLKIILRKLVGNAVKFTKKGQITLGARFDSKEQMMEISVCDTGIGIDKEDQQRIFDMFWQGDKCNGHPFGGVGLGLYIVKRLADQIGAKIALESEKGKGSLFRLRVPVRPD